MISHFEIATGYPVKKDITDMYDTVMINRELFIETSVGVVTPIYYTDDFGRKKQTPVRMYSDGTVRSIPLMEPTLITTPLGEYSAELITFYKSGALKKFFPLNGKIGAYWTEKDEYSLATPITVGGITARVISVHFYESGELQSLQFWPGEKVQVKTPIGIIDIHGGISFFKNGAVETCEPFLPCVVETPIGYMQAWDPHPNGLSADVHSLQFSDFGTVLSLKTDSTQVTVHRVQGGEIVLAPITIPAACGNESVEVVPLEISFGSSGVLFKTGLGEVCCFSYTDQFQLDFYESKIKNHTPRCGS